MFLLAIIPFILYNLSLLFVRTDDVYPRSGITGLSTDRACHQRPPGCELHCPFGYRTALSGTCLCTCHDDPCLLKVCAPSEYCRRFSDGTAFCASRTVSQLARNGVVVKPGECPRLVRGACIHRCVSDADCAGTLKCCSNGCGRECVTALIPLPLVNSLSIHPLQTAGHFNRIGNCPLKNYIKNRKCILGCTHDEECPWVEKCCDNGCGRVCTPPDKATDCVHLISAISRLPEKTLANGYIPKCTAYGKFENIQCDNSYCWCVDEKGNEIIGTKTFKETGLPNCLRRKNCPGKLCTKSCQFGIKTDHGGCPLENCECRNICEAVKCTNDIDICQLVEPECAQPPCQPVPRCLLNPCPNGSPMTLSNGVTALCTHTSQCSPNYWCHQIGFNGLGFCCSGTEPVVHGTSCVPSFSRSAEHCESECRVDSDCSAQAKCCFDGCSLKCTPDGVHTDWSTEQSTVAIEQLTAKGTKVQKIAECPSVPHNYNPEKCSNECKTDQDCQGIQKCCTYGCSTLCLFPAKTTACLHEAITHEIYRNGRTPKCNEQGYYEQIQCEGTICYCVDTVNGSEIPATRVVLHIEPVCNERRVDCDPFTCAKICPFGYELTHDGCLLCECRNPCKRIQCSAGYICVMVGVTCLENVYCPEQPRCLPNVCSSDTPENSETAPILCENERDCPSDYWCNNIGIQSKGMCCRMPWRQLRNGPKCKPTEPNIERSEPCEINCTADDGCATGTRCCYDGCGTTCVPVSDVSTSALLITVPTTEMSGVIARIGECPPVRPRTDCEFLASVACKSDSSCPELQKCCMTACGKRCTYPEKATGCLQMKIAYDKLGQKNAIRCDEGGRYEAIQCDALYCWCVTRTGSELEGTKVSNTVTPNCRARRLCAPAHCPMNKSCAYGFETDNSGCATCKCFNPCKGISCSDGKEVCIPELVDCTDDTPCRAVPKCVVNACPQGSPVIDEATFEPISCNNNEQCASRGTPSFCHVFRNTSGYCCWGSESHYNPGSCPAASVPRITNCSIGCTADDECPTNEKCCFNGCGLSCLPSEQAVPSTEVTKLGECPRISDSRVGCSKTETDECMEDSDCPTVRKCCSNGCKKLCAYPETTTACLHLLGASESFERGSFVPQCDATGDYVRVQKLGTVFWCVDETGRELHGTRTSQPNPNCDVPRSCPLLNCKLDCPLGYERDQNGCDQCRCRNPCKNIRCPSTYVCRLVVVRCLYGSCDPIPKCVLNSCPKGEPLTLPNVHHLLLCNTNENRLCPVGYFCHQIGIPLSDLSYCCVGNEVSPDLCSTALEIPYTNSKLCTVQCHLHSNCTSGKCCFNGCGTSCTDQLTKEVDIDRDVVPSSSKASHGEFVKLGSCSINDDVLDPSCRSECTKDTDCPGFQKCCSQGCGNKCVFSYTATVCIHKLAAYNGEDKKVLSSGPRIECNEDGTFRNIQCDQQIRQCWCVDVETGEEVRGTRVMAATAKPNCQAPTGCSTACDQIKCEHGIRLDANGCPLNGFCECKNPCEEIKCAKEEDVCVLMPVKCITSVCPSVPQCESNPCPKDSTALRDRNDNVFSCVQNEDCGRGACKLLPGEQTHGICCSSDTETIERTISRQKLGECSVVVPSKTSSLTNCTLECANDTACPGMQLCCDYGCSKICAYPETATNCILLHSAINRLDDSGAVVSLHIPQCNEHTGMFEAIQCDEFNSCWCVNTVTGAAVHGSRIKLLDSSLAFAYNACASKKDCSISCNEAICPFGVEMDADGCPRDISCSCRNPCDAMECPGGQICILRHKTCLESVCIPVPSCEVNPCRGTNKPLLDEIRFVPLLCTENRTEICPSGYYCTGYDVTMRGVCCSGNKTETARRDALICPHGDPFSNKADGWPLKCTQTRNDCPSTHYCFTTPDHSIGICCVSKRYVCHLPLDAGPCAVNLKRYYYEYANQTCLPFTYGGCSGNSNNFINKRDCEKFCLGAGTDINDFIDDSKKVETYQLGFSLTGPLLREKHQQDINEAFRKYVMEKFNIDDNELKDIVIRDDNTVQFVLTSESAKLKASSISSAVGDGSFRFTYNGDVYRAEPHSWNSLHIVEKKASSGMLFLWMLVGVSTVFAIIIVASLLYTCCFLYKKNKENASSSRAVSPSQYVTRTGYATPTPIASSPNSGTSSEQFEGRVSSENAHQYGHRVVCQESDWSDIHTAPQTPGGRRRSRTTVYY